MDQPPQNLGYGKPSEATIDQVNQWMRSTPWYQQQMRAWGQDPGHPTLTKNQSKQILRQAQAQGVVVDEGNMEVDDHGNFNPIGHKLRNTLLVAGIAGATIATLGAAGAFAGAGGAAGGAAGAGGAGAGGVLGSTAIGTGMATLPGAAATSSLLGGAAGAAGAGAGAAGAAGGAAAAGGGSTFGTIMNAAGKFGNALQGYEYGRQQGRATDAILQQRQDQNAMEAARLNLDAPGARASNAVQGDILSNAQDFHYGAPTMVGNIPVPSSTGGLRPSIFSPQTRQLGALQSAQALANAQKNNGDAFTPTPLPQPSKFDSLLTNAGAIGQLASLIPYKSGGNWYGGF